VLLLFLPVLAVSLGWRELWATCQNQTRAYQSKASHDLLASMSHSRLSPRSRFSTGKEFSYEGLATPDSLTRVCIRSISSSGTSMVKRSTNSVLEPAGKVP